MKTIGVTRNAVTASWVRCSGCGDDESSLVKREGRWVCDACVAWELEADSLDIEGYEERKRQRLAEQEEY